VRYHLKNDAGKDLTFYHDGFARKKEPARFMNIDNVPNTYHSTAVRLVNRLKAGKCELCGATDRLVMHHVRKLKNFKGKSPLEKRMIARKWKTVALCDNCLNNLMRFYIFVPAVRLPSPPPKDSLLSTKFSLPPTKNSLPPTKFSLPPTKNSLLSAKFSLLATKDSLPPTKFSLLSTKFSLPRIS
jgi:hypothetical protein